MQPISIKPTPKMQHDKSKSSISVKVTEGWDSWGKSMAHGLRQQEPTKSEFDYQLQKKKVNENRNCCETQLGMNPSNVTKKTIEK